MTSFIVDKKKISCCRKAWVTCLTEKGAVFFTKGVLFLHLFINALLWYCKFGHNFWVYYYCHFLSPFFFFLNYKCTMQVHRPQTKPDHQRVLVQTVGWRPAPAPQFLGVGLLSLPPCFCFTFPPVSVEMISCILRSSPRFASLLRYFMY